MNTPETKNNFTDACEALNAFDETFDSSSFKSCVDRAMLCLRKYEAQILDDGYEFNINVNSCRWNIEQAIINRKSGSSMMAAAIAYVEGVEARIERFNGIN